MQRSFTLNDDILMEIFGYLAAGDVLQCRRVCKRMSHVTRERALWNTIYRRSKCPLPVMDQTLPVAKLERLVNRAQVVDAKWKNTHPTFSNIHDSLSFVGVGPSGNSFCVGIKGPYVIFLRQPTHRRPNHRLSITFHWYKISGPECTSLNTIFQYDCAEPLNADFPSRSALDNGFAYEMDSQTGTLYIASVCTSGKTLYLTSIELGEKFEPQTRVFQTTIGSAASYFGVKIVNGFVLCSKSSWSESQVFEIICIRTSKRIRTLVQSQFPLKAAPHPGGALPAYETKFFITPHHLIRILDRELIEVFDLPDALSTVGKGDNTEPGSGISRPSFSGSLPRRLSDINVFPSPRPATLIIVGGGGPRALGPNRTYKVALMTLDLVKHSIGVIDDVALSGVAVQVDRRLTLAHHPATHCITGIAVSRTSAQTVHDGILPLKVPGVHQTLKYVKVSLDTADDPTMIVNELDIPGEVANKLQYFLGVDVYNGRLIFKYSRAAYTQPQFGLLNYLPTEGGADLS